MLENLKKPSSESGSKSGSESGTVLAGAVREISSLVAGDKLGALLGTINPKQREEFWSESALAFPLFSDKITALRRSLVAVEYTREQYPEPVTAVIGTNFPEVEDMGARLLLIDILWARNIKSLGYLDYDMSIVDESEAMAKELGGREQIKKISFEEVVKALLTDKLKLTGQAKSKKQ